MSAFDLLRPWPLKIVVDTVLGDHPAPLGLDQPFGKPALLVLCAVSLVLLQALLAALSTGTIG